MYPHLYGCGQKTYVNCGVNYTTAPTIPLLPPLSLHLSHRPQLGMTNTVFERDYLHGAWQGGPACSAPTDYDTYLMQAPVCLPFLIRAQCAGLGRGDPSPALIAQPHIP